MNTSKQSKGLGINLSFNPFQIQKNYTPRQIALFSAFWTATIVGIVFVPFLLYSFSTWNVKVLTYIGSVSAFFVITYSIFLSALKKYIYRRIKLIYKTIRQSKLMANEKRDVIDADTKVFEEVEKEVTAWAEKQQLELDKYKEWAEYRRRFVGDISHELKTPIFVIQSYLETLLDGAWKEPDRLLNYLKKTAKSTERLNTIVQDLEAIARLETGDLLLDIRTFDIKKLTQDVFEELELKAQKANVVLELKAGASTPYKVNADEDLVRQVLTNLLTNSIKYGKENGTTKVSFYDMDQHVLVEVADDGIGISTTHLPHVFDRFYRVDKSRSRARGGSGLGLSIVKHIIEAHNQTINVRSTKGFGSTFGFTLEKEKK